MLAATRSFAPRWVRPAPAPVRSPSTSASPRCVLFVFFWSSGVSAEPRRVRSTRDSPNCRSKVDRRLRADGGAMPSAPAACPMLPRSSTSTSRRSESRSGPVIASVYDLPAKRRLPELPGERDAASMALTAAKSSGLAITGLGVAAAYALSSVWPVAGALTVAVVLGIVAGSTPILTDEHRPAIARVTQRLLRAGVVLLGLQLAIPAVLALGPGTLAAVVLTVTVTFLGTLGLGKLVRVPRGLALLVATGFSICGASAIAAMEGVVERDDADVATDVANVTCYGCLDLGLFF